LSLARAADGDARPDVVSVTLRAQTVERNLVAGRPSRLAGYSGSVPGPLIRAKRGDQVNVHLENALSAATSLHFHGVRVPNAMDGVPDVTQPAVPAGGSFDYSFVVPDAGLFWYHPHFDSVAELGSGLYGPLLVEDPAEPSELGDEVVLVLSDMTLDANGVLVPPPRDPDGLVRGSEGDTLLVNGLVHPRLEVEAGRRLRLRVLDAARSRYFKLGIGGRSFLQIGGDGGLAERPVRIDEPVLVPGERLDLLVELDAAAGSSLELVARPVSRGLPLPDSVELPLLRLDVVPATSAPSPPVPELARSFESFDPRQATEVPIALTLDQSDDSVTMGIGGVAGADAEPVHARVGAAQVLVVENQTPYAHPFHLHGFFFVPLAPDGSVVHPQLLKDTIDVPPLTRLKLGVTYDDRPGMWMFHCHILDHAEAGMMGMLHVTR
jgi:FtsP/CotA-like multicopper oxidase with cupredoxin domain